MQMQLVSVSRAPNCTTPHARPAARGSHVACSAESSRRQYLAAGLTALPLLRWAARPALALDLYDHRAAKVGIDSIDEARDDSANYKVQRFTFQELGGLGPEDFKRRAKEALVRLQRDVGTSIDKKAWPRVTADLRHQMGTLRYDLDKLTATKDKGERKRANQLQEAAMSALADLDLSARKNGKDASQNYQAAVSALSDAVTFLT